MLELNSRSGRDSGRGLSANYEEEYLVSGNEASLGKMRRTV